VTPVAVMTQPLKCPGQCLFCPTYPSIPQSYTPESPAVLRAIRCGFDPQKQVKLRLKALSEMGHPTDKIELIVMGGTFLAYPQDYQYRFIKECLDGLNGQESADLAGAKELNETAQHRCTGMCIETRPDWCGQKEIERMLEFGTTRVELGVQVLDDQIYRLTRRGHKVEDVVRATALLRQNGFKVHYHWMPGLPGSTPEHDLEMSRRLFDDERFKPDGLKLYPTMVVEGTELERWYKEGRYQPYEVSTMVNLMMEIKSIVPKYVRISRVLRDIPAKFITAGCKDSLRGVVRQRMRQRGLECKCIRCREYGHRAREGWEIGSPRLVRTDYQASGGREIFLSFEDEFETLFGLLRLRVQETLAVIRELHIYGPEVPLSEQKEGTAQHRGLGKALLMEAERITAEEFKIPQMKILSGIGAREYYRSEFGYHLEGDYMVRELSGSLSPTERHQRSPGQAHSPEISPHPLSGGHWG
jgi:elongator complex protein 3